jgi:hypothetical protein
MRRFSNVVTILITSIVMALAGLVANPIATASENDGSITATFAFGSSAPPTTLSQFEHFND